MDTKQDYWSKRWDDGKIGWHKSEFNKHLVEYTNQNFKSNEKKTVFVPLCGKTKDLIWLNQQGCQVVGIEFCQQAVAEFFTDNNIKYEVEKMDDYEIYSGEGGFKIYRGCFFKTPISEKFDFIYDRASLVAIDPELRPKYADKMKEIKNGPMLLIALVREEGRTGPPHTVTTENIKSLYGNVTQLSETEDISSLERLGKLVESVYVI